MCKKRKKTNYDSKEFIANPTVDAYSSVANSNPIPQGTDYFAEYYKAYKNDYIDQYLRAYHEYKRTGEESDLLRELQGFDSDIAPQPGSDQ